MNDDFFLFHYNIQPIKIESLGKVQKITTEYGDFALKKTSICANQADEMIHSMRQLSRLGYKGFVPIISTKNGEYTIKIGGDTYYLMPWIQEVPYTDRDTIENKLVAQLAKIHRMTVGTKPYLKDDIEQSYEQLRMIWEEKRLEYSYYMDQIERKVYFSPFELTFLSNAYLFDKMADAALYFFEQWYELCSEKEKIRTVLCHGRLEKSHALFVSNDEPLLLNFEDAMVDTLARDLAQFYFLNIPTVYWSDEATVEWFTRYEYYLPLLKEEKYLLLAYLNFPIFINEIVDEYVMGEHEDKELTYTVRLEKEILSLQKVRYLTNTIIKQIE